MLTFLNSFRGTVRLVLPLIILVWRISGASAQYSEAYTPDVTRILFLLDGSGSMKEDWDGETKFNIAKRLISDMVDSLYQTNPNIEFGIRIFGHQSPRNKQNCTDSKLEIEFGRHSKAYLEKVLSKVNPQGWTPIAYSLQLAAKDFPDDSKSKNAIILVTDGIETCGGDPCEVGEALQNKRISLKPFIIGLGLDAEKRKAFDCVGRYYDAYSATSFKTVLNTVIKQSLNNTTAQINLLNQFGKPTVTDIEISMYDSYSGDLLYSFIHTLNEAGFPDTLKLDPTGKYDIEVHTIPSVTKKDVELTPGTHNIIAIEVPQGELKLIEGNISRASSLVQCLIRKKGENKTLYVQNFNSTQKYLTGMYDLEILSLPRIHIEDVELAQGQTKEVSVDIPGTLYINSSQAGIASIYKLIDGKLIRVYEFKKLRPKEALNLLPGKYKIIYRLDNNKNANFTRMEDFEINPGLNTSLRF